MMPQPLTELFLRARDQHVATGRRAYVLGVALLLVQVLVVTPWIEHDRDRVAAIAEEVRFVAADEVGELARSVEEALEDMGAVLRPALSQLSEGLESDLARLDVTVEELSREDGEDASGEDPPAADDEPAFEVEKPEWRAALEDAIADGSRYGLLAALDPIVENLVVEPRYGELRRTWNEEARPEVEPDLDRAAAAIPRLRRLLPETEDAWGALEGSLTGLRAAVRDLEFTPPAEPYWWAAPEGSAGSGAGLGLTPALRAQVREPLAVDQLVTAAAEVGEKFRELDGRLEDVREQTLSAAREKAGRRSELGGTLTGLGLDLRTAVTWFPLLLGLLLAMAISRRAQRLRELGFCAHLLLEAEEPGGVRTWSLAQIAGPGAGTGAAARRGTLRALGVLALALAWIAAAALQTYRLDGLDERSWWIASGAGAAAVLAATIYRLLAVRRVAALLEEREERSAEHVSGHPLAAADDAAVATLPASAQVAPFAGPADRSVLAEPHEASDAKPGTPDARTEGDPILDGHTLRR